MKQMETIRCTSKSKGTNSEETKGNIVNYLVFLMRYDPSVYEVLQVLLKNKWLFGDLLVHQGLCEHRFIYFIVSILPVANLSDRKEVGARIGTVTKTKEGWGKWVTKR